MYVVAYDNQSKKDSFHICGTIYVSMHHLPTYVMKHCNGCTNVSKVHIFPVVDLGTFFFWRGGGVELKQSKCML